MTLAVSFTANLRLMVISMSLFASSAFDCSATLVVKVHRSQHPQVVPKDLNQVSITSLILVKRTAIDKLAKDVVSKSRC
jgi:hypothetical protein